MRIFISGGCKNGKSYYAQRLAKAAAGSSRSLYYIATMKPADSEDDARIKRHRRERDGWGFTTVEQASNIEGILQKCDHGGSFLIDSITALLANEMFPPDGDMDITAGERVVTGLSLVINGVERIVIVSDFIYSDAAIYDPLTERYRKSLAEIDKAAAGECDVVLEIAHSGVIVHKGKEIYNELCKEIA